MALYNTVDTSKQLCFLNPEDNFFVGLELVKKEILDCSVEFLSNFSTNLTPFRYLFLNLAVEDSPWDLNARFATVYT